MVVFLPVPEHQGNLYAEEGALRLVQLSINSKLSCLKNRQFMFFKQLIKKLYIDFPAEHYLFESQTFYFQVHLNPAP